jgi:hypothetical protein
MFFHAAEAPRPEYGLLGNWPVFAALRLHIGSGSLTKNGAAAHVTIDEYAVRSALAPNSHGDLDR